jgi:predicted nucleic acid-binding protein
VKVFLDTSVLVAAVILKHEHHARAFEILDRVQHGTDEGYISGHSMAELYSILTKLPLPYRHTPEQALLSIEENVLKYFKVIALAAGEYSSLIREAALLGIQGGTIYDAILLKCAIKSGPERILTFNLKHFQNIAPESILPQISTP